MSGTDEIVIGTRGSQLALWQARTVQQALTTAARVQTRLEIINTSGDKDKSTPLKQMSTVSVFTKEIEQALLDHRIDLAVHSLKDLTTTQPEGLTLAAVGFRGDRRELLLVQPDAFDNTQRLHIRPECVIGTGSTRRACQIAHLSARLNIADLRGNVPTRVQKLRDGHYDAIILAIAGVQRLGLDLSGLIQVPLDTHLFYPAPGQAILALETRTDDKRTLAAARLLNDPVATTQARLERGLLARFNAGCSLPLGVISHVEGEHLSLEAILGIPGQNPGQWQTIRTARANGTHVEDVIDTVYSHLTTTT
jgi:hydroxymethylbilane synthase